MLALGVMMWAGSRPGVWAARRLDEGYPMRRGILLLIVMSMTAGCISETSPLRVGMECVAITHEKTKFALETVDIKLRNGAEGGIEPGTKVRVAEDWDGSQKDVNVFILEGGHAGDAAVIKRSNLRPL
jgi:hypothetical protein